jgi:2-polyprenyl-3-methyl-5-hydroxy-6-metoxy-1,4-benzoquinol methylase
MVATVKDHYDNHLAPLYTWISGGVEAPRQRFADFLRTHRLLPRVKDAVALDLGAGNGCQSLSLAAAGYAVTAIDLSHVLLAELARNAAQAGLDISTLLGDLREFSAHAAATPPSLIVCLGDTLTHLASSTEVAGLLHDAATALTPGGHLVLMFRDYTLARTGADRFIPVRSEEKRIFTCFLDYGPTHVTVHDILHTREGANWHQTVSAYEKIRLSPEFVREQLLVAGLNPIHDDRTAGLVTFIAQRAPTI